MDDAVRLREVSVRFGASCALSGVSATFAPGSLTAVCGPNGGGKSTLLEVITGRVTPDHGEVVLAAGLRRRLAYLPQRSAVDRGFPIRVLDAVLLGLWAQTGAMGRASRAQRLAALAALDAVGLREHAGRLVAELSAGQFQRTLFARIMMQDASLVLLDEPFAAVDEPTQATLMATLAHWHRSGRTIIAVIHDLTLVRADFPRALLLDGRIIAAGATADVLTKLPSGLARSGACSPS